MSFVTSVSKENKQTVEVERALYRIIKENKYQELEAFVQEHDIDLTLGLFGSRAPLFIAVYEGFTELALEIVRLAPSVLDQTNEKLQTPLHIAALFQRNELAKQFLELGAEPYPKAKDGKYPHDYSRDSDMNAASDENRDARPRGVFSKLWHDTSEYKQEQRDYANRWLERRAQLSRTHEYDR